MDKKWTATPLNQRNKSYGKIWVGFRLRGQHGFRWQSLEILNVFNTFTLKQIFWKTKIFFKKLECWFLVESTMIQTATFPYKTALSKANIKINRIRSTKWTYPKDRGFAVTTIFFWKFNSSVKTSYKLLI